MSASHKHSRGRSGAKEMLRRFAERERIERKAREEEIFRLQGLDRAEAIASLRPLLESADSVRRREGAEMMLRIDRERALELVLPLLADRADHVRGDVCQLLQDFGNKRAVAALIHVMRHDLEDYVREAAASALGALGDARTLPALRRAAEADRGPTDAEAWGLRECALDAIDCIMARRIREYTAMFYTCSFIR